MAIRLITATAGFLAVLAGAAPLGAQSGHPDYSHGTHLVLLGTGNPNADPDRWGPAVAVVVNGTAYLVDAGVGVVRRAAAAAKFGVSALEVPRLDRVFITHLHTDHTLGLPDLIFSPWVLDRHEPLHIYGPPGTAAMAAALEQAYSADVRVRIDGLEPIDTTGYKVDVHEVSTGGVVYRDTNVTVTAFPVEHGSWKYAFGYRFDTKDKRIVISGDTRPTDAVVEACDGCDILVHEVYSADRLRQRSPEWQAYHRSAHTSTAELARIAARAHPKLLVLYHELFWGATPQDLLDEIGRTYHGRVVAGKDLDIF
jgi:ribonuclease BN (tRNA processing enzyme)